jgi:hypothetical protein
MASVGDVTLTTVLVDVTAGVAGALPDRFVQLSATAQDLVVTAVPTSALGAAPLGILAEAADLTRNGRQQLSMVVPRSRAKIFLGEAVTTIGAPLRVGGFGAETDGAAFLANAAGDIIVGYARETGAVGEIIMIEFTGYNGLA